MIVIILIPILNFVFVSMTNSYRNKEIIYANSGKIVYWGVENNHTDRSYFEMDDIKYVIFHKNILNVNLGKEKRSDPVANLKDNPSTREIFNEIWTFWLMGKASDKIYVWTIYHITTDNGYEYYNINDYGNFMAEEKLSSIKEMK